MIRLPHRALLILRGTDATPLMQGLITNDVRLLESGKAVAAFLLNIKGRIVEDIILWQRNDDLLVECSTSTRKDLKTILEKYRLRKKVEILATDEPVCFSTEGGDIEDPRLSSFGFRLFGADAQEDTDFYHDRRRELGIAEGSEEIAGLLPFQCNGDFLKMVSLDKGCYIGQELTARTAHTGVIRKRILPFKYNRSEPLNEVVLDEQQKKVGDMSSKHLRRLLEEKEKQKQEGVYDVSEDDESPHTVPLNRFAFLGEDSESESNHNQHENFSETNCNPEESEAPKSTNKQKSKKKKKSAKKTIVESDDEDELLEKLAKENANSATVELASKEDKFDFQMLKDVFKIDPKKFNPRDELKAVLGKAFKEPTSSKQPKTRDPRKLGGRIVKQNPSWPPAKNIGLAMVPCNESKKEFKYTFSKHYEMLERMALIGERSMDISTAQEILQSEMWHLHSLLLLANASLMQEDITNAMDLVERGIYYCEQNWHAFYDYTELSHRIKYSEYENRAYYLLLHKYMLLCMQKRCFETALNYAKLICTLDIRCDPLAMFLILDTLAIKAKKYDWLTLLLRGYTADRKMDLLPNFIYSRAMSTFLSAKTNDQKEEADKLLEEAIQAFPGVVTHLIDVLQIQPDSIVENNQFLSTFAFNKEQEGFKMVAKIYVNQSQELWKQPEVLLWLERISRKVAMESSNSSSSIVENMRNWVQKRFSMFVGIPEEVRRLSVLLGLSHEGKSVTDPIPPAGSVNNYLEDLPSSEVAEEGLVAGFINSIFPDYDPSIPLAERLQQLGAEDLFNRAYQYFRGNQNPDVNQ